MNDDLSALSYPDNPKPHNEYKDMQTNGTPTSLTSQTYQCIHDMIIRGDLPPGQKLKIETLRKTLGTGASPIREALSLLTNDHLVERIDQRGFRVAHIDLESFQELLKTRCWLEEIALRESIEHGDDEWEERLVLAHHRLSRTPRSIDSSSFIINTEWEAKHRLFHIALLSACGSSMMLKFCDQLYDQNVRYRNIDEPTAYPKRSRSKEHDQLLKLSLDRKADEAVDALVKHYIKTGDFLSKQIE